jgi:hypothetical protein
MKELEGRWAAGGDANPPPKLLRTTTSVRRTETQDINPVCQAPRLPLQTAVITV